MGRKRQQAMQLVHPNYAGIDVGKSSHYVAVAETAAERLQRQMEWTPPALMFDVRGPPRTG